MILIYSYNIGKLVFKLGWFIFITISMLAIEKIWFSMDILDMKIFYS